MDEWLHVIENDCRDYLSMLKIEWNPVTKRDPCMNMNKYKYKHIISCDQWHDSGHKKYILYMPNYD